MNLRTTYNPSYFSLEDIVASQIPVPSKTEVDIPHCGFLAPSSGSNDLPRGSTIELPLWAAKVMSKPGRRFVKIEIPSKYKQAYRDVFKADPKIIDLNKFGPHFYHSGLHVASLAHPDAVNVAQLLPDLFLRRAIAIADAYPVSKYTSSQIQNRDPNLISTEALDSLEKRLFDDSRQSALELVKWGTACRKKIM